VSFPEVLRVSIYTYINLRNLTVGRRQLVHQLQTQIEKKRQAVTMATESKPPFPPFTLETAQKKVKAAQDAWNTKKPEVVQYAYTPDSIWRNRDTFLQGREEIVKFLTEKWAKEDGYRLRKELFAFTDNKVWDNRCIRWCWADSIFRLQSSSGTNGTTRRDSGGGRMASKTGRLQRTA
jgi:nuclear transport factor 2 (NTF2) superfamily protein